MLKDLCESEYLAAPHQNKTWRVIFRLWSFQQILWNFMGTAQSCFIKTSSYSVVWMSLMSQSLCFTNCIRLPFDICSFRYDRSGYNSGCHWGQASSHSIHQCEHCDRSFNHSGNYKQHLKFSHKLTHYSLPRWKCGLKFSFQVYFWRLFWCQNCLLSYNKEYLLSIYSWPRKNLKPKSQTNKDSFYISGWNSIRGKCWA